ncbi:MAG: ABC transporter ATP-binding protein [Cyclobacteriaceae bacterium]|jgi:lipoprotein-releasing system ATP-binding protein
MGTPVLEARQVSKHFRDPVDVKVLNDVNFIINRGEFVSVVGKSGCGKSTLLYVLSTMDTDYEGEIWIDGENMKAKSHHELAHVRNQKIGFVFQFHYLLHEFTVLENVMLPALKLGIHTRSEITERAMHRLKQLEIEPLARKAANQISGGEKQRVAIARALINDPLIIMGDEPTGNLDIRNSEIVFGIFRQLAEEFNQTMLIVTHDLAFADRTQRVITMEDGRIVAA